MYVYQYLTFNNHISGICKSTHFFYLRSIGRNQKLITFDTNAKLIYALITISLDFCKCILYNLQTTRLAGNTGYKSSVSTYFKTTDPFLP